MYKQVAVLIIHQKSQCPNIWLSTHEITLKIGISLDFIGMSNFFPFIVFCQ